MKNLYFKLENSILIIIRNPDMIENCETELKSYQEWNLDEIKKLNLFDDVKFLNKDNNQPNIYCTNKNISDNEIVFNGHSDVVPVTKEQDKMWNLGTPWGGEEIDNKIYGRGASDMKGGNISFLYAIKALKNCNITINSKITYTLVSGEETGNHSIGVDNISKFNNKNTFIISGEPTNLNICTSSVGEFYFKLSPLLTPPKNIQYQPCIS